MGFWHTGYMEFHEEAFFGATAPSTAAAYRPPAIPCPDCGRTFHCLDDLEVHRFNGHAFARPVLLLRGRECGRSRLTVAERTAEQDWVVLDSHSVTINGHPTKPDEAGTILSTLDQGVASVTLTNDKARQDFDLKFAIADPSDLDGVDERLRDMVKMHRLTIAAIEGFLSTTRQYATASDYRAGIATYLYGVLAREQSSESGLDHDAYRDRFDEAVSLLGGFDRLAADVICGLVAFHYNQFDRAVLRSRSPRVSWASSRLLRLLAIEDLGDDDVTGPERSSLDFVLSDALTEQVLGWCCIPLDGSAAVSVNEMEEGLPNHEPFDQLKLRIIASEHHLRSGAAGSASHHVNELRHNPVTDRWARRRGSEPTCRQATPESLSATSSFA